MTGSSTAIDISNTCDNSHLTRQFSAIDALLECAATGDTRPDPRREVRSAQILIIEDEAVNARVTTRYLRDAGYLNCRTTLDSRNAAELILQEQPDLVLLDLMMPEVDGLTILRKLRQDRGLWQTPVIVLTATEDRSAKLAALELGANDFLTKPVDLTDLLPRIRNVLSVKAYQDHLKDYARELERQVQRRTEELAASRLEVIYCLGRAAEFRDHETGRHVIRVGRYVGVIARTLGMDETQVRLLEHAAPLHDMGKIGIPDAVLLKTGPLNESEIEVMRRHTEYGFHIVSTMNHATRRNSSSDPTATPEAPWVSSPILRMASIIALTHHERWDGKGYPRGLSGEQIPLEGRITAVADVFDALCSPRPYKQAYSLEECFRIMAENRGTHFDPRVLDAFFSQRAEITRIYFDYADEM